MLLPTLGYDAVWLYSISVVVMVSMITTVLSCLCCRRKQEIKTLNAPHRSLPDIPIAEPAGDNNSELYATVGDKVQDLPQGRSPTASLKKQTSVSQHSSISQADDISSPYARVRSPPHAYDKLRRMEHPYAQVSQPGNNAGGGGVGEAGPSGLSSRSKPRDGDLKNDQEDDDDELMSPISRRESTQNLEDRAAAIVDIPAASAIAGRVSASQDLPYMTPPIVQPSTQHFSGDSQDSSKGYTSISVREPLANLLPQNLPNQATAKRRQILGDSHYATVSDDSDEMYAAIDDPNNQVDLYTSGSETYAQIQPPNAVTVSVEINTGASSKPQLGSMQIVQLAGSDTLGTIANEASVQAPVTATLNRLSNHSNTTTSGDLPHDGGLRAQSFVQHSRQASSSSCTSSVGNLGSPKPEKRQANSPLPPTPKTLKHQANNFFSNSNQSMHGVGSVTSSSSTTVASGRNSAASVIDHGVSVCAGATSSKEAVGTKAEADNGLPNGSAVGSRPKKSPSKDLEGMYAKVMKKNKLSKLPSQNSSPVALRKDGIANEHYQKEQILPDCDLSQINGSGPAYGGPSRKAVGHTSISESSTQRQIRNSTEMYDCKDPGYETIPGDGTKKPSVEYGRKPADYAQIQKLQRSVGSGASASSIANTSMAGSLVAAVAQADSEAGYESLPDTRGNSNDPGYETLNRDSQRTTESDSDPNYEILRPATKGPSPSTQAARIPSSEGLRDSDGYSSIREPGRFPQAGKGNARNRLSFGGRNAEDDDTDSTPGYSSIKEKEGYDPGYSIISERKKPPLGHDYASITEDVKNRKPNINNNLEPEEESDIYSSIPHTASGTLTLTSPVAPSAVVGNIVEIPTSYSTITERPNVGNACTLSSSPAYSSISETRTTPSSTDGDGDGSTSSPDQIIGYNKHNNTNTTVTTTNSLSRISSNYESLTGSESDPNYESVKYLNVTENPYERLHNEAGGVVADVLRKSVTIDSLTTDSDTTTPTPNVDISTVNAPGHTAGAPDSEGAATAVSDYFQV